MIDLHMHSTHSDGTDSVIDILKKAQARNLTHISITDHNTCSAYQELKRIDVTKYYSGKIIVGIELNTIALGIPIEILGYEIDVDLMQEKLNGMYLNSEERNRLEIERLYNKCLQSDINLQQNFVSNYSPEKYASRYLHEVLTQNEYNKKIIDEDAWNDSQVLYGKYMSDPKSLFFVDTNDVIPNLEKTIELVRECNGKVFLPHIFEYKHNSKKILDYILNNYKIDGIECYYSTFSDYQTNTLLALCKEKRLLVSGGSDYHGLNNPEVEMGIGKGGLKIPESIIFNWS